MGRMGNNGGAGCQKDGRYVDDLHDDLTCDKKLLCLHFLTVHESRHIYGELDLPDASLPREAGLCH